MKKILAIALAIVMVFSLAACGGGETAESSESTYRLLTTAKLPTSLSIRLPGKPAQSLAPITASTPSTTVPLPATLLPVLQQLTWLLQRATT